jgi:uncharacterized protein (DUF427 family)
MRSEPTEKRIRTFLGGELVADTDDALMVWDVSYHPSYYVPLADVRPGVLEEAGTAEPVPGRGPAVAYTVRAGGREAPAWRFADVPELADRVAFDFAAMGSWFEEDEEIWIHPRSPYKRVDVLPGSRHVRVEVGGVTVAETNRPTLVFETGVPRRFYLPMVAVRQDLLTPSDTVTFCPYKGEAIYWHLTVDGTTHEDLVWSYQWPVNESIAIAGLVCFYPDRVTTHVDGGLHPAPPEDVATMPSPRAQRS